MAAKEVTVMVCPEKSWTSFFQDMSFRENEWGYEARNWRRYEKLLSINNNLEMIDSTREKSAERK
jgi:hypothetical protein